MPKRLPEKFYKRDTVTVARELLGCTLVHLVRGRRLSGRITETEAYLGPEDPAAHSFGGRQTARIRSMFLSGGHAYVFFVYGMHYCFNVVTREAGRPEAVLIRAIEPLEGIESMRRRRQVKRDSDLANGPGKLCQALMIDRRQDGLSLIDSDLFIERGTTTAKIAVTPRIGIDYAGHAVTWPLRFVRSDGSPKEKIARKPVEISPRSSRYLNKRMRTS